MKAILLPGLFMLALSVTGQSISSSLVSTAGAEYQGSGVTLTVSVGETVIDTYTSPTAILTTGFLQGENSTKPVDLALFLEGLYNGEGLNKAQDETGNHWPGDIADIVTVSLARNSSPYDILYSIDSVSLLTDGSATLLLPVKYSGMNYLVVNHRNSLETWSANPLSFANNRVAYSFLDAADRAYGSNQLDLGGQYALYGGDVTQDGFVDMGDITAIGNESALFVSGYVNTDVTGDGIADAGDMIIVDNNAAAFVAKSSP